MLLRRCILMLIVSLLNLQLSDALRCYSCGYDAESGTDKECLTPKLSGNVLLDDCLDYQNRCVYSNTTSADGELESMFRDCAVEYFDSKSGCRNEGNKTICWCDTDGCNTHVATPPKTTTEDDANNSSEGDNATPQLPNSTSGTMPDSDAEPNTNSETQSPPQDSTGGQPIQQDDPSPETQPNVETKDPQTGESNSAKPNIEDGSTLPDLPNSTSGTLEAPSQQSNVDPGDQPKSIDSPSESATVDPSQGEAAPLKCYSCEYDSAYSSDGECIGQNLPDSYLEECSSDQTRCVVANVTTANGSVTYVFRGCAFESYNTTSGCRKNGEEIECWCDKDGCNAKNTDDPSFAAGNEQPIDSSNATSPTIPSDTIDPPQKPEESFDPQATEDPASDSTPPIDSEPGSPQNVTSEEPGAETPPGTSGTLDPFDQPTDATAGNGEVDVEPSVGEESTPASIPNSTSDTPSSTTTDPQSNPSQPQDSEEPLASPPTEPTGSVDAPDASSPENPTDDQSSQPGESDANENEAGGQGSGDQPTSTDSPTESATFDPTQIPNETAENERDPPLKCYSCEYDSAYGSAGDCIGPNLPDSYLEECFSYQTRCVVANVTLANGTVDYVFRGCGFESYNTTSGCRKNGEEIECWCDTDGCNANNTDSHVFEEPADSSNATTPTSTSQPTELTDQPTDATVAEGETDSPASDATEQPQTATSNGGEIENGGQNSDSTGPGDKTNGDEDSDDEAEEGQPIRCYECVFNSQLPSTADCMGPEVDEKHLVVCEGWATNCATVNSTIDPSPGSPYVVERMCTFETTDKGCRKQEDGNTICWCMGDGCNNGNSTAGGQDVSDITPQNTTGPTQIAPTAVPTTAPTAASETPTETPVTPQTPTETPVTPQTPTETPVTSQTPTETPVTSQTPTETPVTPQTPTETPTTIPSNITSPTAAVPATPMPTPDPPTEVPPTEAPTPQEPPVSTPTTPEATQTNQDTPGSAPGGALNNEEVSSESPMQSDEEDQEEEVFIYCYECKYNSQLPSTFGCLGPKMDEKYLVKCDSYMTHCATINSTVAPSSGYPTIIERACSFAMTDEGCREEEDTTFCWCTGDGCNAGKEQPASNGTATEQPTPTSAPPTVTPNTAQTPPSTPTITQPTEAPVPGDPDVDEEPPLPPPEEEGDESATTPNPVDPSPPGTTPEQSAPPTTNVQDDGVEPTATSTPESSNADPGEDRSSETEVTMTEPDMIMPGELNFGLNNATEVNGTSSPPSGPQEPPSSDIENQTPAANNTTPLGDSGNPPNGTESATPADQPSPMTPTFDETPSTAVPTDKPIDKPTTENNSTNIPTLNETTLDGPTNTMSNNSTTDATPTDVGSTTDTYFMYKMIAAAAVIFTVPILMLCQCY